MSHRTKIRWLLLLLALVIPTAVVFAQSSTTLGPYQFDLVSVEHDAVTNYDTFTYAVTGVMPGNALSHWTLGIYTCSDYLITPSGSSYTTINTITQCGDGTYPDCQIATYTLEYGFDPTLQVDGVKYNDPQPAPVSNGITHVFEITVSDLAYVGSVEVGAKYGTGETVGTIDGPICGGGTAISLASNNASSAADFAMPLVVGFILLSLATVVVYRKRVA
jgi:hypothetical protein